MLLASKASPYPAACQQLPRSPLQRNAAAVAIEAVAEPPSLLTLALIPCPTRMPLPQPSPPQPAATSPRHHRLRYQHRPPKGKGGGATRSSCCGIRRWTTSSSSLLCPARPLHHRLRRLCPLAVARYRLPRLYQSLRCPCCRHRRRRPSRYHPSRYRLRRFRLRLPDSRSRLSRRHTRLPIRHRRQLICLRRLPLLSLRLRLRHYPHHHHLLHLEHPISNSGTCAKTAMFATMKKCISAVGFVITSNPILCECRMNVVRKSYIWEYERCVNAI